ncbi:MAG: hypothetical protein JST22_01025 [Bacteroidetes bacterium]|nr:hypothetical protein [Bacteroidota bacterium]
MKRTLVLSVLLSAIMAIPALAQIPQTISYQGMLRDASGGLVNGTHTLTFRIYDAPGATTPLWEEVHSNTAVSGGIFNVILGGSKSAPRPLTLAFNKKYYLGVVIDVGGTELPTRVEFTSSPYALNAQSIIDNGVITSSIKDSAVTTPKLGEGSVTGTKIANGTVVRSINGLHDDLFLKAGQNITITPSGDTMTIASTASANSKISRISVGPGLTGGGDSGTININVGTESIINTMLGYHSVTESKIEDNSIITRTIADAAVTPAKINVNGASVGMAISYFGGGAPVWGYPWASQLVVPFAQTAATSACMVAFTQTGTGQVMCLTTSNAANSSNSLEVTTNGTGNAIRAWRSASTGIAAGVRGETNSQDANASAIIGVVTSTTPGGFSAALRGTNNGTGGLGIGVVGTQAGSGWGVYGTTPSGIGVYGLSTSGFGVYGQSTSGVSVYGIQPSNGTSSAGYFQNTNTANSSPALFGTTNGTGPAVSGAQGGTADAGLFSISNAANTAHAVNASTNGSGNGVNAVNTGTGRGGLFSIVNAANANNALEASTNGTGRAGYFNSTNAAGTADAVNVVTAGTGRAIGGTRRGGSGITLGQTEAIRGDNTDGPGVAGTSNTAVGLYGTSVTTHGVWGVGVVANAAGVEGRNDVVNGFGVEGVSLGGGIGVHGTSQTGNASQFDVTNAASTADAVRATQNGLGRGVYAIINNTSNIVGAVRGETNGGGYGVFGQATGNGNAGFFQISNPASTSSTMNVTTNGIGSGVTIQLTNASNGARGVDVLQAGVGPGVFATSAGGNAVWGITSSISAAGVIGDNTFGEAVVGRNRGGNGVGAVVGRNDSSGYGCRGFNTKDGIGVLGQAGISGGTGVGGRFENVNAANGNDALQAATNGTGWAANFTNANNSSASRGLRIATTAGQGGNALTIANGTVAMSYQHPYASNTVVDDAILVVTTAGNVTIPTGPPLVDGATVWVVNNAGAVITLTNTTAGAFNINPGRACQMLFVSTVSGANWIPVQP